jgi:hypothetical protein
MPVRPLLAVLVGLLAWLCLSGPASAGHAHHGDDVQAERSDADGTVDKGCCTAEGAHCASAAGLVVSPAISLPADERVASAPSPEADGPHDRIPDLQPKPPRA